MSTTTATAARPPLGPVVATVGAAAGLSTGAALAVSITLNWSLALATGFIAVPALVCVAAVSASARPDERELFLRRLGAGALAGLLATAAYDGIRLTLEQFGLAAGRSFLAIPLFGAGLTGLPPTSNAAVAAGWAFHVVNGVGFATAYTLLGAGRPWWLGIAFALVLEGLMVSLYPGWLRVPLTTEFLSLSVCGHLGYGAVLGVIARRTP